MPIICSFFSRTTFSTSFGDRTLLFVGQASEGIGSQSLRYALLRCRGKTPRAACGSAFLSLEDPYNTPRLFTTLKGSYPCFKRLVLGKVIGESSRDRLQPPLSEFNIFPMGSLIFPRET